MNAAERLQVIRYLLRDIYTDEGVETWLHERHRSLYGCRPIDLIEAGEVLPVLQKIAQLTGGPNAILDLAHRVITEDQP